MRPEAELLSVAWRAAVMVELELKSIEEYVTNLGCTVTKGIVLLRYWKRWAHLVNALHPR